MDPAREEVFIRNLTLHELINYVFTNPKTSPIEKRLAEELDLYVSRAKYIRK